MQITFPKISVATRCGLFHSLLSCRATLSSRYRYIRASSSQPHSQPKFPFSPFYHSRALFGVYCITRENDRSRFLGRTSLKVSRLFQTITIGSGGAVCVAYLYVCLLGARPPLAYSTRSRALRCMREELGDRGNKGL